MSFYRCLMIALFCLSLTACGQDNPTLTADTAQNTAEQTQQNQSADPADTEHDHAEHEDHDHAEHEDHDHDH